MSEYSDEEFLNTLEVAGPESLSPTARSLIKELFFRVQALEARSIAEKATELQRLADDISEHIEALGSKPDKNELRDGMKATLTAVRHLALTLAK